jgi:hypothetical protein
LEVVIYAISNKPQFNPCGHCECSIGAKGKLLIQNQSEKNRLMPAGCCQSNIAVIVPASKSASMPSIVWKRLRASVERDVVSFILQADPGKVGRLLEGFAQTAKPI